MINCEVCNKGLRDGVSVYRQNPKGETGIWRCLAHTKAQDEELLVQVASIENTLQKPTKH